MSARAKVLFEDLSQPCQTETLRLLESTHRRSTTPVRKSFVRSVSPELAPPLARIVSTRGRGGAVPLKLFLGLVRRSSAAPYDTNISARRWASLLNLDAPNTLGARRIGAALGGLAALGLVDVQRSRGEASRVTLLREDGSGVAYSPPSEPGQERRYLQMPDRLWKGDIQQMSGSALAMLLILLAEPSSRDDGMWWSVESFPAWYSISESMRARGTKELCELGLIKVTKRMLDTPRGGNGDQRDRVRNIYKLRGRAKLRRADSSPPTTTSIPLGGGPKPSGRKRRRNLGSSDVKSG